jgi:hypothetical protein
MLASENATLCAFCGCSSGVLRRSSRAGGMLALDGISLFSYRAIARAARAVYVNRHV